MSDMVTDKVVLWTIILGLGVGTFLIRFSFLGMIGDRPLPAVVQRMLRYTPMAVIPGLVAPAVFWPEVTNGSPEPVRLAAAAVTVLVGVITRRTLLAVVCGAIVLTAGLLAGF